MLNPRLFVGAEFGTLTVLAVGAPDKKNKGHRHCVCVCRKYGLIGEVLASDLLAGKTVSGSAFPGQWFQDGILVDKEVRELLPPNSKWHINENGYARAGINGKAVYLHRIIWELVNGPIPAGYQIDHVNRDPLDNRLIEIVNLRLANKSENGRNAGLSRNNTSGVKGVTWHKQAQKWLGQVVHLGRRYSLGLYDTIEEAKTVVEAKRAELHGEFTSHG